MQSVGYYQDEYYFKSERTAEKKKTLNFNTKGKSFPHFKNQFGQNSTLIGIQYRTEET